MTPTRTAALAALVLSAVSLVPGTAQAAGIKGSVTRQPDQPIQPKEGEIVLFIGMEGISGLPTGRVDGVIAVSHQLVSSAIGALVFSARAGSSDGANGDSPQGRPAGVLARFRQPRIYAVVVNHEEMKKAGLTEASLSRARLASVTIGGSTSSNPNLVSISIDVN
jgi:hypothetical protein